MILVQGSRVRKRHKNDRSQGQAFLSRVVEPSSCWPFFWSQGRKVNYPPLQYAEVDRGDDEAAKLLLDRLFDR